MTSNNTICVGWLNNNAPYSYSDCRLEFRLKKGLYTFSQSLKAKSRRVPQIRPQPCNFQLIIAIRSLKATYINILPTSLYKPEINK
jgi:hypothetical protein